jgi:hypothetical protein
MRILISGSLPASLTRLASASPVLGCQLCAIDFSADLCV